MAGLVVEGTLLHGTRHIEGADFDLEFGAQTPSASFETEMAVNPLCPFTRLLMSTRLPTHSFSPLYPAFHSLRLFSCESPHSSSSSSSQNDTFIANALLSLLSTRPLSPDDSELNHFSPNLTPKVVEKVLLALRCWRRAHFFFIWASNQHGYTHNCHTYNAMASILSRVRQNAALRLIATDMLHSRCFMTAGALGFFLRCLGAVGLSEVANFVFDEARLRGLCNPNNYSYNCLLEALSISGSIDSIEARLKEMADLGWRYDKYTLTPVLKAYSSAGKFENALNFYNLMCEQGWVDAHIFSIMVVAFSKFGEIDKAVELVERMEDHHLRLNAKTFVALIHLFVKESREETALYLLSKMRNSGFGPDVSLYDSLIGALCKKKEMEKAFCLLADMKELGIGPGISVLAKLLSHCSEERDMIDLFEKTQKDVENRDMVLLCNSVLTFFVNNGLVAKAYNLLQLMMGDRYQADGEIEEILKPLARISPDANSFGIIIDGLLKIEKVDEALSLFKDMVPLGCEQTVLLYNNLIGKLCAADRLNDSYELIREMKEKGFQPTHFTHNSLYKCLCNRGDVQGAVDLLKEMRVAGHDPWIKHSTLLVMQLCNNVKPMEACNFLADMVDIGFLPGIVPYSAAINGLMKIKKVDQALQLFQEVCSRGCCPDMVAYNTLINGLCKANRISEAEDLLNEMWVKGLVPSTVSYNSLIDGWCKNGNIDRAILCLSRMVGENREPSVVTYTTLIDGFCNARKADDAVNLWSEMEQKGYVPNRITHMALIQGLCKCGRPEAAQFYLQKMEDKKMEPDIYVYVALINAFLSDSNFPKGFMILKTLVDKGNMPDPTDKNFIYLRDAILILSKDVNTSSSVKNLIAQGMIPTFSVSDV